VADVTLSGTTGGPGIFAQIRLVAGLRWRILRNLMRVRNSRLDIIGLILAAIFAGAFVIGLCWLFGWGAYFSVSTGHFAWLLLLFWSIGLFWQAFPLFVAGFGAPFEFRTLLRFPLRFSAFYLIGLAYGLADFAAACGACWLLSIGVGVSLARLALFPQIALVIVLFIWMNITLERLLSSWLERLLARRRTRELLFGLFILLSVSAQFLRPAIIHYTEGAHASVSLQRLVSYLSPFPPSLAGSAVIAAGEGHSLQFVTSVGALLIYIVMLSALLWQRFAAQYRGEELSETSAAVKAVAYSSPTAIERKSDPFGLLSPQFGAILTKEVKYLFRNGFVLISLLMPPVLVLLFSSQFSGKHPTVTHTRITPDFFFPGMMGYLILMLMTPAYNCFAYESKGIRNYYTAPIRFREVLLAKNLMYAVIIVFEIVVATTLLSIRVGLPSGPVLAATILALVFAVAGQFAIADWVSLSFPRKLEYGSMRGQRGSGVSVWIAFGVQILLAGICTVILFAGRWAKNPWLPAEAFAVLALASLAGYFAALDSLSNVAEKKKEVLIETLSK
jgi:ABC-2 type transport system permease protein